MKAADIITLARQNVKRLKPYSSARDDFEGTASVFLDANENPYPNNYNRYPDPHQKELKKAISKIKGVAPNCIFLGNGSDEAIDLLYRVFCEPGCDEVIIPQPTYGMYAVSAEVNNVKIIPTQLTPSFNVDPAVLKSATPQTKMVFLCSPNNPSGNLLSVLAIENILNNFSGLVIVDEAYIDFTDSKSWAERLAEFPNLVVLQTFSKAWGLAGLRLGMCFANEVVIQLINKIKPPYNINAYSQSETLKAIISGEALKNQWVKDIRNQREILKKSLSGIKSIKNIHPTDANFLLVEVADARGVYKALINGGIVVRDRSNVILCDNCLRITVGTPEENQKLIQALEAI
ncbi:MAG TPA: histidinol-phosphate transaminase [Cyclobacteriaceae bacterium]|nr:histidinol-phosphate transaminase [Cyclobacteriaceae bacterium]